MRTLRLLVGIIITMTIALVIYIGGFYKKPAVRGLTFRTEIVHLQLGKSEYAIPNNYFGTNPGVNCNAQTATIDVLLPDFEPRTKANYSQFLKTGKGRRTAFMLLKEERIWDADATEYIRRQVAAMTKRDGRSKAVEADFDLTSYPTEKVESYGDLFVHYVDGAPQNYLRCSKENSAFRPNSNCQHSFPYRNMLTKITYPRFMLPNWKVIEADTKAMLDRFYVGPATKIMKPCHDTF